MELVPFKPAAGDLAVAGFGPDAGSIPAMVAAQQGLLHEQVDQLQRLVIAQCRLTGVNPLAQEMVRAALVFPASASLLLRSVSPIACVDSGDLTSGEAACKLLRGVIC